MTLKIYKRIKKDNSGNVEYMLGNDSVDLLLYSSLNDLIKGVDYTKIELELDFKIDSSLRIKDDNYHYFLLNKEELGHVLKDYKKNYSLNNSQTFHF